MPVVSGLSSPLEIGNANDGSGRLYVVQQAGTIRIVKNGVLLPAPFLNITAKISSGGERGLLGLAFHPNYRVNGRYFVYYTRVGDGAIVIERYQRAADNVERTDADPSTVHTLITIPHPGQSNHNGGKLAFGPDGYLYAGTGDGGSGNDPPNNAQTLGVRLGKMLRFDVDRDTPPYYSIPPSNPWATYPAAAPAAASARRSGRTGCAIPGASRSIVSAAINSSEMSARARARKSTGSRPERRGGATMAGA